MVFSRLRVLSAAAITLAVASAQEPCSASSWTCTALSGPIESALRIESAACAGPAVSAAVTVVAADCPGDTAADVGFSETEKSNAEVPYCGRGPE